MTNPAKDDEALVERVARAIWDRQRLQPDAAPVAHTWQQLCADGVERYGKATEWIEERRVLARAAIAAVRAHDEQLGMVTLPAERVRMGEPLVAMLRAYDEAIAAFDNLAAAKPDGDAA